MCPTMIACGGHLREEGIAPPLHISSNIITLIDLNWQVKTTNILSIGGNDAVFMLLFSSLTYSQ